MPKFLDVPSWYNSQGTLSYGVGVDTNERPTVGDVPSVHLSSGELNWRALMVNGGQSGDINIYAPTSGGNFGQILQSNGNKAPIWGNITFPIYWTKNREVIRPNGYALSTLFTFSGSEKYTVNMALFLSSSGIRMNETGSGSSTITLGSRLLIVYVKNGMKTGNSYEDDYFGISLDRLEYFSCRAASIFYPQDISNVSYSIFRMFS